MSATPAPDPQPANRPRAYPPLPDWAETRVIVTHYSTGILSAEDATPAGSAMVFHDLTDNRCKAFSPVHTPGRVAEGIADYLAGLPDGAVLLHWNGEGVSSGFVHFYRDSPALEAALFRGGLKLYDFSEHLKAKYGSDYAGHPRLESVLVAAGRDKPGYLDQEASARAYAAGNWGALWASLVIKAEGIEFVYRQELAGTYRPPNPCSWPASPGATGPAPAQSSEAAPRHRDAAPQAEPDAAASLPATPASPVDGPAGGCWLWWNGSRHNLPKGVIYKLVHWMWARDCADYEALDVEVFGDAVTPQTVRARASEASKAMQKIGVPWRLQADSQARVLRKQST